MYIHTVFLQLQNQILCICEKMQQFTESACGEGALGKM